MYQVSVVSKRQKTRLKKVFFCILEATEEQSKIRIRTVAYLSKRHGYGTPVLTNKKPYTFRSSVHPVLMKLNYFFTSATFRACP